MENFAVMIKRPVLRNRMQFHKADVECACCGRPIKNRNNCNIVIHLGDNDKGEQVFKPLNPDLFDRDPVEWGFFVGPRCAKLLPKTHKVTMKKLLKNADKW